MNDEMNIEKYLDEALKRPDVNGMNDDLNKKIMFRIQRNIKQKQEQKRFVLLISSVFVSISVFIVGYVLYSIVQTAPEFGTGIIENSVSYFNKTAEFINKIFPSGGMSIIGSMISIGLIISAYFYFDLNKQKLAKNSR